MTQLYKIHKLEVTRVLLLKVERLYSMLYVPTQLHNIHKLKRPRVVLLIVDRFLFSAPCYNTIT